MSFNPAPNLSPPRVEDPVREHAPTIHTRRFLVRFGIAATASLFVAMVGMLYYSWWRRPVGTTALIVVVGDKDFAGTKVQAEGAAALPMLRVLEESNDYSCRIPVVPGAYTIVVELGDRVLVRYELVRIREHALAYVDLRKMEFSPPIAGMGNDSTSKPR